MVWDKSRGALSVARKVRRVRESSVDMRGTRLSIREKRVQGDHRAEQGQLYQDAVDKCKATGYGITSDRSLHVTRNWRLTFQIRDGEILDIDYEDYH